MMRSLVPVLAPLALAVLAAGAPALAAAPDCADGHVVQRGDTLYSIARRCGVAVPALIRANPFIGNVRGLETGWRLEMPGGAGPAPVRSTPLPRPKPPREAPPPDAPPPPAAPSPPSPPADDAPSQPMPGTHEVRRGETLYAIARAYRTTPARLIALNPGIDPGRIEVGQLLRVEADAPAAPPTAEPAPREDTPPPPPERKPAPRIYRRLQEAPAATPSPSPPPARGGLTVTGIVTDEGVECPALRSRSGELWTLAGSLGRIAKGDRLIVEGREAEVSACMQGRTLLVDRIRHQNGG